MMEKSTPTVSLNMSLTQEDMNKLLRAKARSPSLLNEQIQNKHQISKDDIEFAAYLISMNQYDGVGLDIALGVGHYLFLNMKTGCFCISEEALDDQCKNKPGYKRAIAINEYLSLVAAGGFFSAQQALNLAFKLIVSELAA